MDQAILESVITITNQRDVDSLEYSLVATLLELLCANEVAIYKSIDDGMEVYQEETLRLCRYSSALDHQAVQWSDAPKRISRDADIQRCFDSRKPILFSESNQLIRIILPIFCDDKTVAALSITSHDDLTAAIKMLEGIVRIYENYLFILNESETDKLTGLFNRRTFDKKLDRLLQIQRNKQLKLYESNIDREKRSLRPHSEAWLAIIDIDHFKQVNDQYGHIFGDGVLLLLAHKMKISFRQSDYIFRFGGEEFVVILEPHPNELAFETLDRFRRSIASHTFPLVGQVTVSIGYARITESDYPPTILHSADKALYYAKAHGRDCVFCYETLLNQGAIKATPVSSSIDVD